jgi:hypothetical protein
MSAQNVDVSTTTLGVTAIKLGDFNAADGYSMSVFPKATGASTAIRRGYACTRVNTVTPNKFAVTTGATTNAVVIAGLPFVTGKPANINVTGAADGNGEDISAEDADVAFNGITDCGSVCVRASGAIQPGQQVMTATNGRFAAYDGSGADKIKGIFIGLPGSTKDGAYIAQAAADGQLILIDFDGVS